MPTSASVSLALLLSLAYALELPGWNTSRPDASKRDFGWDKVPNRTDSIVYMPQNAHEDGMYNHAAMLQYFDAAIHLSWKNAPEEEDTPGQRVLYSSSSDGTSWSKAQVLFPNMSTDTTPVAQFAGPFATLNGHLYASATPAIIADGDAQGRCFRAQFCLWPDGLEPRNCATPDRPGKQPRGLLMMRRIVSRGVFGPVFWVYEEFPSQLAPAAEANGVKTLSEMDSVTRADLRVLLDNGVGAGFRVPCERNGTLKCEACEGGCESYATPGNKGLGLANERTHYRLPGQDQDVLLYRAHSKSLWASVRQGEGPWSPVVETSIPNDDTNINTGPLPGQLGVYLVSNAAPTNGPREPLTLAISHDGLAFTSCRVIQTCHDLAHKKTTCKPRAKKNHNVGPSYPQGLGVVAPAPEEIQGFFVVATNNKEDVVVTKVPWASVLAPLLGRQ